GDVLIGEDDLAEDVGDEVALRLGRDLDAGRLTNAERARHVAHQALEGLALLRAAGEIEAAEERVFLEGVAPEQLFDELREVGPKRAHLQRELEDLGAAVGLRLAADDADRARRQRL